MSDKICRECGGSLCKVEIINVKTNEYKGHVWGCEPCDMRYVGFGDQDEYDGTIKQRKEDES